MTDSVEALNEVELGWELVERPDSSHLHLVSERRREAHLRKVQVEEAQAWEAYRNVQRAADKASKWRAERAAGSDIAMPSGDLIDLVCIPGSGLRIIEISRNGPTGPVVVTTHAGHELTGGHRVVVRGVKPLGSAWEKALNTQHDVKVVGACDLELTTVFPSSLGLGELLTANVSDAEIVLTVAAWEKGQKPLLHSALFAAADVAHRLNVEQAYRLALNGLSSSCTCLQQVSTASLNNISAWLSDGPEPAIGGRRPCIVDQTRIVEVTARLGLESSYSPWPGLKLHEIGAEMWRSCVAWSQPGWWQFSEEVSICEDCLCTLPARNAVVESYAEAPAGGSRHHCRHCGRIVCQACALNKQRVPWRGYDNEVTICKSCVPVVNARNYTIRLYHHLLELLSLEGAITYTPRIASASPLDQEHVLRGKCAPKGKGKGQAPPPPSKGKGRGGKESDIAKQSPALPKKRGLSVLGEAVVEELQELAQYVVVSSESPRVPQRRQAGGPGLAVLDSRELFRWQIARHEYVPFLDEISHCLNAVNAEGSQNIDRWLPALEQVLPLDDLNKLSVNNFKILQQFSRGECGSLDSLRACEREICLHFLSVPNLSARFIALQILQESCPERIMLSVALRDAQAAYRALLSSASTSNPAVEGAFPDSSDSVVTQSGPQLCEELKSYLRAMANLLRRRDLASLAEIGITKLGRNFYDGVWRPVDHASSRPFSGDVVLERLSVVDAKGAGRAAGELHEIWQRLQERRAQCQRLETLAEPDGGPVRNVYQRITAETAELESEFQLTLALGGQLLEALGELPHEDAMKINASQDPSYHRQVASDVDKCVMHLRKILDCLRSGRNRMRAAAKSQRPQRRLALSLEFAQQSPVAGEDGLVLRSGPSASGEVDGLVS